MSLVFDVFIIRHSWAFLLKWERSQDAGEGDEKFRKAKLDDEKVSDKTKKANKGSKQIQTNVLKEHNSQISTTIPEWTKELSTKAEAPGRPRQHHLEEVPRLESTGGSCRCLSVVSPLIKVNCLWVPLMSANIFNEKQLSFEGNKSLSQGKCGFGTWKSTPFLLPVVTMFPVKVRPVCREVSSENFSFMEPAGSYWPSATGCLCFQCKTGSRLPNNNGKPCY